MVTWTAAARVRCDLFRCCTSHRLCGVWFLAERRKGFPPFDQVWDLMKDDTNILMVGFILSAMQG